jgi:hypothetical protein
MSESRRNKAGLHKKISSIFKGVPVQKKEGLQQTCEAPEPKSASYTEPEPASTEPQEQKVLEKQEFQSMDPQAPQAPEPKKSLVLELDESNAPEPQEPQVPEPQVPQILEPKKSLVLELDESNAPEPQEPQVLGPQESQTSNLQEPQAPKSDKSAQSLPKTIPAQVPKSDIEDIEKIVFRKSSTIEESSQSFWQRIKNKLFSPTPGVSTARQKAMVIMVPILFIALIFLLRGVFGTTVHKTEAVEENTASRVVTDSDSEIDWKIPEVYPATLRDPMRLDPSVTDQPETKIEAKKVVRLSVQGILYTEDKPSAVVSNRIVHEGEIIRGATVVKISKDSVEFEMDGKRWIQKVRR